MSKLEDIINIRIEFKENSDKLISNIEKVEGRKLFIYSEEADLPIGDSLKSEIAYRNIKMKADGDYLALVKDGEIINVGMKAHILGMILSLDKLFEQCDNGYADDLIIIDIGMNTVKVSELRDDLLKVLNNILYFVNDNFIMLEEVNTERDLERLYELLNGNNESLKRQLSKFKDS